MKKEWTILLSMGLLAFTLSGCGNPISKVTSMAGLSSGKNSFSQYAELANTDPLDARYVYYYTNSKLGPKFDEERVKIEEFGKNPGKTVYIVFVENGLFSRIFSSSEGRFEVTDRNTRFRYAGELSGNTPDGLGIIYETNKNGDLDRVIKGNFKDGEISGYAQEWGRLFFSLGKISRYAQEWQGLSFSPEENRVGHLAISKEGIYKNSKLNGEGIVYSYNDSLSAISHRISEMDKELEDMKPPIPEEEIGGFVDYEMRLEYPGSQYPNSQYDKAEIAKIRQEKIEKKRQEQQKIGENQDGRRASMPEEAMQFINASLQKVHFTYGEYKDGKISGDPKSF